MFIDFENTYQYLIGESDTSIINTLSSTDKNVIANTFIGFKAIGICISDTYNHPIFPMARPIIDTSKLDATEIYAQYQALYSGNELVMLPWHYLIELIGDRYVVLNTRPIDTKYPLTSSDMLSKMKAPNSEVEKLLKTYELQEFIHIGIIGNSNIDVYTQKLYDVVKMFCILPIKRIIKMRVSLNDFIIFLNIGKKIIKSKFFQELG